MEMNVYHALLAAKYSKEDAASIVEALERKTYSTYPFEPGRLLATRGVDELEKNGQLVVLPCLLRHLVCDWGELEDRDKEANFQAMREGTHLLSTYNIEAGDETKLCIYTAADRSFTLFLLPHEKWVIPAPA
ncbi:hypothetical protein HX866_26900 [Pseudomonas gingeri]|uniref:hypothetical protein n=1 Tax=Pseudomonas gingeri TaxID=117681 RepID=UPI0015A1B257|nr:hypothetical protein [Pseudomonas gingeri]NWA28526.1 hypothetical protein [Pseudomonas gingeri]